MTKPTLNPFKRTMHKFSNWPAINAAVKRAQQHLRVPPELLDEPLAQECPPTEGATLPELCPPPGCLVS